MTLRHLVVILAALVALGAFAAAATADPPPLEQLQAQIAAQTTPDGYQPQLAQTSGAVSHPDNATHSLPVSDTGGVTVEGGGGFSWSDAAIGLAVGVTLSALAVAVVVTAGRHHRSTLAHP